MKYIPDKSQQSIFRIYLTKVYSGHISTHQFRDIEGQDSSSRRTCCNRSLKSEKIKSVNLIVVFFINLSYKTSL